MANAVSPPNLTAREGLGDDANRICPGRPRRGARGHWAERARAGAAGALRPRFCPSDWWPQSAAVAFRFMISYVHNLFFLGKISGHYDANQFDPASPLRRFHRSFARCRRTDRRLAGEDFRAGGQGPRRPRSHVCDLPQPRRRSRAGWLSLSRWRLRSRSAAAHRSAAKDRLSRSARPSARRFHAWSSWRAGKRSTLSRPARVPASPRPSTHHSAASCLQSRLLLPEVSAPHFPPRRRCDCDGDLRGA